MPWWETVLRALWLFLPAYAANMAPVLVAKILPMWNAPLDGGRVGRDGRRLLGAGKTWRGLVGGAAVGGGMALAVAWLAPHWGVMAGLDYGDSQSTSRPAIFAFGAAVGLFALLGDAVKSYFKRRRGKEGGAPWIPFDQLDFVVAGLVGMLAFSWLLPAGWVWGALTGDWLTPATLLVLTPLLHFLVNVAGYALRLKRVPW